MNKNNKIIIGVIIAILVVAGIWYGTGRKPAEEGVIKIGVLTILSGDLAFLGDNVVKSANLALEEINKNNKYGKVELVVEDVGGLADQGQAVSSFRKLVEIDKVQFIIDGMTSNATMAVAPLIDQYKVLTMSVVTGGENIDNAADYLFRNGPSDIKAGTQPAADIYDKFGYKKVALMTDNAEYTLDIAKQFRKVYKGEIVADEIVTSSKNDYRTEVLKIKNSGADALFLSTADGVSSTYIIKQAKELGITIPIFANFIAFGPNLVQTAGNKAEGVYIYDPQYNEDSPAVKNFLADYKVKYNMDSPIRFHSTGTYDAVKMALEAISKVGDNGEKIREYLLQNIKNWQGFNGIVTFDDRGHANTGFVLKQIKNSQLVVVK